MDFNVSASSFVPPHHQTDVLLLSKIRHQGSRRLGTTAICLCSAVPIPWRLCHAQSFPTRSSRFVLCTGNQHRPKESTRARHQWKLFSAILPHLSVQSLTYLSENVSLDCLFSAISIHRICFGFILYLLVRLC